jgi:hypothetical protein
VPETRPREREAARGRASAVGLADEVEPECSVSAFGTAQRYVITNCGAGGRVGICQQLLSRALSLSLSVEKMKVLPARSKYRSSSLNQNESRPSIVSKKFSKESGSSVLPPPGVIALRISYPPEGPGSPLRTQRLPLPRRGQPFPSNSGSLSVFLKHSLKDRSATGHQQRKHYLGRLGGL